MKKLVLMLLAAGTFTFTACDSKRENQAEENAEMKEEAADDADNEVAEDAAEVEEDSLDAADPQ